MKKWLIVLMCLLIVGCATPRGAERKIQKTRAYIEKWEAAEYSALKAKEILVEARRAHKEGDYKEARKLAKESLQSLKVEVKSGPIIFPIVSNFVGSTDFPQYKTVAVLPFSDAPNSPSSGQTVQGLVSQSLAKAGFDIMERACLFEILSEQALSLSGILTDSQSIKIGELLGVKAIVVGEVGQYATEVRKTDTTYFPMPNYQTGQVIYYPRPGQTWTVSFVSISLRVIDVETGQVIYSGSGQFNKPLMNLPQQAAEYISDSIIMHWIIAPGACGFWCNPYDVIESITIDSPAEQAGLKRGDKIIRMNGKNLTGLSRLEKSSLFWGQPGEKVTLEIQRDDNYLTIEMTRVPRETIDRAW